MSSRFVRTCLFISVFTIFVLLPSFHPLLVSIGGATIPQNPNATLPPKTLPPKKPGKRKPTRPTKKIPTPAATDFIGMTIVLNRAVGEGTISGKITWSGPALIARIDTSSDPVCGQLSPNLVTENTVVKDGKLANVFVYIKDGTTTDGKRLGDLSFDVPTSGAVLDQRGCRFVPHVLGLQISQKLVITNKDPTTHNIHFVPRNNPEWNRAAQRGEPPIEHSFARAEVMLPVKDNQHPWMKAYIGVLPHPFYAVTNADGSFEIRDVPAGTYTLVAWREGGANGSEKMIQVTVNPKANAAAGGQTIAMNPLCKDGGVPPCPTPTTEERTSGVQRTVPLKPATQTPTGVLTLPLALEMVWIPPGSFMMGSETISSDEKPAHRVTIGHGFRMGKYEVIIADWRAVMRDIPAGMKKDLARKFTQSENQPVVRVSADERREFIAKLNAREDAYTYRLPTEAEWEYACRAGTASDYAGDLDAMAWYSRNSGDQTHPVGQKQPNAFGLYDMHGNVWEWCGDLYHENYVGAPTDGTAWGSGGEREYGVLRGGSWRYAAPDLRSAYRRKSLLSYLSENIGLRLVAVSRIQYVQ